MSAREIVIVSPERNPGSGGLADYTLRLKEEWRDRAVRVVVPQEEELPRGAASLLVQYSAYGFDRHGYPRALLRRLHEWKANTLGARLVLMLHEIWAFWPWWNKNAFVQRQHRSDLLKLVAAADAVFTSTPSQVDHLRAARNDAELLPVGSNIRVTAPSPAERDNKSAVIFGLPATRLRVLRELAAELRSLAATGAIERIITLGRRSPEEDAILRELPLRGGFEARGEMPEADVSRAFAQASFAISVQDPLSITKSGSFMAYAAHGLNIISPYADSLGAEPLCWLTHPRELRAGNSAEEPAIRQKKLQAWQERTASWPRIAARFAEALGIGEAAQA